MLDNLIVATWIGIGGLFFDPTTSHDYPNPALDACAISVTCGPGLTFSAYSYDMADVGEIAEVGPRLYGITGLADATLTLENGELVYDTHAPDQWASHQNIWRSGDASAVWHFLFFQTEAGELFVAIEDMAFEISDLDYNDGLYQVHPVPEPGTLALLMGGLAYYAVSARKRASRRR